MRLFNQRQLEILDTQEFDPVATYHFDVMSGSFRWSDEFPDRFGKLKEDVFSDYYVFRLLLAHRHDLTLDEPPRDDFDGNAIWQQLKKHAPNWPGLREERYTGRIVKRLKAAKRLFSSQFDKWEIDWDIEWDEDE